MTYSIIDRQSMQPIATGLTIAQAAAKAKVMNPHRPVLVAPNR